ncbi:hypothetical protein FIBSPDRAFT_1039191 [Athelia psychrophila]|uniref:Uncharacterized protein n=1 Tax=Athelia psychrophila TaxID=1759441 RepID=A0A166RZ71_9AGAM|nr:hypothetical protein FIBSPDRAFT_1039191 [Fibularhizoctonia sp. CBS 109695]
MPPVDKSGSSRTSQTLDIFLRDTGARFRDPVKPNNWLGGDRPFPLNHSFKPPVPVSDALRTQIYAKFMSDPVTHSENKPFQTGFQAGMERCLGVTQHAEHSAFQRVPETAQADVREADALMKAEGNDPAPLRYRKMFWEPVADGKHPVVPPPPRACQDRWDPARASGRTVQESLAVLDSAAGDEQGSDVGGKFIDKDESLNRIKKLAHRSSLEDGRRAVTGGEKDQAIRKAAAEAREKYGQEASEEGGDWKEAMEKARAGMLRRI